MAKKLPKIELTLLKKLVSDLEASLTAAQELPTEKLEEAHEFISAMSKTSGLAAGVAQEASALVKDCYQVSRLAQQPASPYAAGEELLAELFGGAPTSDKNRN